MRSLPPRLLLLGAGFSRNWGGWLADEAFEYLIGVPAVRSDAELLQLLWDQRGHGGFESALGTLQWELSRGANEQVATRIATLQSAIGVMFRDMNSVLGANVDFNLGNNFKGGRITDFLAQFDAIFTLNQDLLLEKHYAWSDLPLESRRGWRRPSMPGAPRINFVDLQEATPPVRVLDPPERLRDDVQPIFKLHGSSNWMGPSGDGLLVMGMGKFDHIQSSKLLRWYQEEFRRRLEEPGARLMVIGYSFGDGHINSAIEAGVAAGLRLFIIDPKGVDVFRRYRELGDTEFTDAVKGVRKAIIGASRRPLHQIFNGDLLEHKKVMRFFD